MVKTVINFTVNHGQKNSEGLVSFDFNMTFNDGSEEVKTVHTQSGTMQGAYEEMQALGYFLDKDGKKIEARFAS